MACNPTSGDPRELARLTALVRRVELLTKKYGPDCVAEALCAAEEALASLVGVHDDDNREASSDEMQVAIRDIQSAIDACAARWAERCFARRAASARHAVTLALANGMQPSDVVLVIDDERIAFDEAPAEPTIQVRERRSFAAELAPLAPTTARQLGEAPPPGQHWVVARTFGQVLATATPFPSAGSA